jgi:hypothetical protein
MPTTAARIPEPTNFYPILSQGCFDRGSGIKLIRGETKFLHDSHQLEWVAWSIPGMQPGAGIKAK